MQRLIDLLRLNTMMENVAKSEDAGFLEFILFCIGIAQNLAWFVLGVMLPFYLISIMVKLNRRLGK